RRLPAPGARVKDLLAEHTVAVEKGGPDHRVIPSRFASPLPAKASTAGCIGIRPIGASTGQRSHAELTERTMNNDRSAEVEQKRLPAYGARLANSGIGER
ncbi:MAG: hypothetical protein ACHQAQ_04060, partial [Hyphomicrobiales bacterium]